MTMMMTIATQLIDDSGGRTAGAYWYATRQVFPIAGVNDANVPKGLARALLVNYGSARLTQTRRQI